MKLLPLTLIALLFIPAISCRKHGVTGVIDFLGSPTERRIKINQAVLIYYSTALNDSLKYVDPPATRLYKWLITPTDGSYTFSDDYQHGRAEIIFHRSGDYFVSANIYDSSGQHYTGHTDAMEISVTTDTLYPTQAISRDDQLTLTYNGYGSGPGFSGYQIGLVGSTTDSYDYYVPYTQLQYTSTSSNGYSFVFSDSVYLGSYPFAWGYGITSQVWVQLELIGYTSGVPQNLSFTWLDKTYTGKVTITTTTLGPQTVFIWDNSGAVKLK